MYIETKVFGSRIKNNELWQVNIVNAPTQLTLREFLKQVVLHEVAAFHARQEARKLVRFLSKEEIAQGAAMGKVSSGGSELNTQSINPEQAVETALLAFSDGFYYVFVDDAQITDLDHSLTLTPDSRALFLRLVPIVGG